MPEQKRSRGRPRINPEIKWTPTRGQLKDEMYVDYIRYRVNFAYKQGDITIYRLALSTGLDQANLHRFKNNINGMEAPQLHQLASYLGVIAQ